MTQQPQPSREPGELRLAMPDFVALCRDVLARDGVVRFRAHGVSMRPAIKPGDLLTVEPLRDTPPQPGEVILAQDVAGHVIVHRVVMVGAAGGTQGLVVTAPDGYPGRLDAPVALSQVLGRVTLIERDGSRFEATPIPPTSPTRWRARWALSRWGWPRGFWFSKGGDLSRRLIEGILGSVAAARHVPLLGPIVGRLLPDLGSTCQVEVTPVEDGRGTSLHLDAMHGGHVVGRAVLRQVLIGDARPQEWWITTLGTRLCFRRRGIASRLLREALRLAGEHGSEEVAVWVAEGNRAAVRLLKGAGFELAEGSRSEGSLPLDQRAGGEEAERAPGSVWRARVRF